MAEYDDEEEEEEDDEQDEAGGEKKAKKKKKKKKDGDGEEEEELEEDEEDDAVGSEAGSEVDSETSSNDDDSWATATTIPHTPKPLDGPIDYNQPDPFVHDPSKQFDYVIQYLDEDLRSGVDTDGLTELRYGAHLDHIKFVRKLTRDPNSGIYVSDSLLLLSDDEGRECGSLMTLQIERKRMDNPPGEEVSDYDILIKLLKSEPTIQALNGGVEELIASNKIKIFRWKRLEGDPLLSVDDGKIFNLDKALAAGVDHELHPDYMFYNRAKNERDAEDVQGYPTCMLCEDRDDAGTLRGETREAHLKYLRKSGRVMGAGPVFKAIAPTEEEGGDKPCGSLVLLNSLGIEDAKEFGKGDPYFKAGLFKDVLLARFNCADVSGKFLAVDKYATQEDAFDEVEYELEREGGLLAEETGGVNKSAYDPDNDTTPWGVK
jgi:uncharacterized protein YciI